MKRGKTHPGLQLTIFFGLAITGLAFQSVAYASEFYEDAGICAGAYLGSQLSTPKSSNDLSQVARENLSRLLKELSAFEKWAPQKDECIRNNRTRDALKVCLENKISDSNAARFWFGYGLAASFASQKSHVEAVQIANSFCVKLTSSPPNLKSSQLQGARQEKTGNSPAAPRPAAQAQAPTPAPAATNPGRPAAAPDADPALARIDGRWYSDEWKYGYTLRGGVGTATVSNSPNFKPGDQIIFLKSAGETRFVGEQIYKDGKFYTISVSLMPDGRLAFQGDRNVKWIMRRDD
jgi:hypothetical protein